MKNQRILLISQYVQTNTEINLPDRSLQINTLQLLATMEITLETGNSCVYQKKFLTQSNVC